MPDGEDRLAGLESPSAIQPDTLGWFRGD